MKNITILVVGHKTCVYKLPSCYRFVAVGKNKKDIAKYDFDDSIGESISDKNNTFNEFTGQYWAFRNLKLKDDDIVGLVHYRRFFFNNFYSLNREKSILKPKKILKFFKKHKVILPTYYKKSNSLYQLMTNLNDDKDLTYLAIKNISPEYLENYRKIKKSEYRSASSMFICTYKDFVEYSDWCFKILFEFERLLLEKNGKVVDRQIGFFGEWLPNLYFGSKYSSREIKRCWVGLTSQKTKFPFTKYIFSLFGFFTIRHKIRKRKYPL